MAWREDAARSLTGTFDRAFDSPGVVVAAACVDKAGTGIAVSPGDAPADGRFEPTRCRFAVRTAFRQLPGAFAPGQ